jgi:hypothetical protein
MDAVRSLLIDLREAVYDLLGVVEAAVELPSRREGVRHRQPEMGNLVERLLALARNKEVRQVSVAVLKWQERITDLRLSDAPGWEKERDEGRRLGDFIIRLIGPHWSNPEPYRPLSRQLRYATPPAAAASTPKVSLVKVPAVPTPSHPPCPVTEADGQYLVQGEPLPAIPGRAERLLGAMVSAFPSGLTGPEIEERTEIGRNDVASVFNVLLKAAPILEPWIERPRQSTLKSYRILPSRRIDDTSASPA